jgi:hypothetical protein
MGGNRKHLAMTITPNKWELDVQGYLNVCNITDPLPRKQIRDFAAGVNDLGLWNSMVCWPLRSSQNYGSGATAFSLGGLGTFNGTLVNGPTWGVDGITFDGASSQEINIGNALNFTSEPFSILAKAEAAVSATPRAIAARWNTSNNRSWFFGTPTASGFRVSPTGLNEGPSTSFSNASVNEVLSAHFQPSTHIRIYRESVLNNSTTASIPASAFNATSATTFIGGRGGADSFTGKIRAVVAVYNTTQQQHEALIPLLATL